MLRLIVGIVIGVVAWFAMVFIVPYLIGFVSPAVNAAMREHHTVVALAERLGVSFLASLVSGYVAARVAAGSQRAPLIAGILLLIYFVPYHLFGADMQGVKVWTSFPLWYHLTFFVSLVVLSVLGGRLARGR